jgi:hypothetical protein
MAPAQDHFPALLDTLFGSVNNIFDHPFPLRRKLLFRRNHSTSEKTGELDFEIRK